MMKVRSTQPQRQVTPRWIPSLLFSVFTAVLLSNSAVVEAARFTSKGPVLTITLKDSADEKSSSSIVMNGMSGGLASFLSPNKNNEGDGDSSTSSPNKNPWFNWSNFRPNLVWSLQSQGTPLPNWLPGWQSLRTSVGYQYDPEKRRPILPSFLEADLAFSSEKLGGITLEVQPSYDVPTQQSVVLLRASRGAATYLMGKFASKGDRWLQQVRACYQTELPSQYAIRVTPTLDLAQSRASCLLEAMTASQRTKAILNLEYDNPTLTVVHSLDERNTIAPEISLYNARILYQWNIALDNAGSSIRTKVDPTSAIQVTWTDKSTTSANGGKWITDVRVPLAGTTLASLSADVRVRRQFSF